MITTKEMERKALEKIRKIVAELGEDSYVATAFEGCFEKAEENIENDFACSWKQIAQINEREATRLENQVADLKKDVSREKARREKLTAEYEEKINELNESIKKLGDEKRELTTMVIRERKELKINDDLMPFKEVRFVNNDGFMFFNVVEESGWTTSYRAEELNGFAIK